MHAIPLRIESVALLFFFFWLDRKLHGIKIAAIDQNLNRARQHIEMNTSPQSVVLAIISVFRRGSLILLKLLIEEIGPYWRQTSLSP